MVSISQRRGKLSKFISRILPGRLPEGGRRAVFLTTLFMEVAKLSPAHQELIEDLNHRFQLVPLDSVLKFPMYLKDEVWEGRQPCVRTHEDGRPLTEKELEGLARRIIVDCPEWSRYTDFDKVLEETKEVIRTSLLCRQADVAV